MIDLTTVKELRTMRLPGMARELESQLEDPQRYKSLSFEDRLALLVDAERASRRKNSIQRKIREARFSENQASVEAIEYYEDRELDKGLITKLATCAYIRDNHHVILKGATGAGKSYIANALGIAACRQLYKVRYIRMPDLLNEYAIAKSLNTQGKVKKTYARFDLLIIDEWLLRPLPEAEAYDLLELVDACSQKGALIICTQYDTDDWYYRIDCDRAEDEGSAVAEGVLDRIINNKYSIEVKGRISMRKRHAFLDEESGVNVNG
ncbi:MAG: ATP-binding protein [Clostridiales bacterium]|nr:ATP-binding protein [Clostridiales bacterium]